MIVNLVSFSLPCFGDLVEKFQLKLSMFMKKFVCCSKNISTHNSPATFIIILFRSTGMVRSLS